MEKLQRFIVRYGEGSRVATARSPGEAADVVRDEYETEWGKGTFAQFKVTVEKSDSDADRLGLDTK